jgi:hypothetical protein
VETVAPEHLPRRERGSVNFFAEGRLPPDALVQHGRGNNEGVAGLASSGAAAVGAGHWWVSFFFFFFFFFLLATQCNTSRLSIKPSMPACAFFY